VRTHHRFRSGSRFEPITTAQVASLSLQYRLNAQIRLQSMIMHKRCLRECILQSHRANAHKFRRPFFLRDGALVDDAVLTRSFQVAGDPELSDLAVGGRINEAVSSPSPMGGIVLKFACKPCTFAAKHLSR
jgi:hypothetical protein